MSAREGTLAQVLVGEADWVVVEGDCLEVLPTIPDKAVAHVITDPPYSEHVHAVGQIHKSQVAKPGRKAGQGSGEGFGFASLTPRDLDGLAGAAARIATRWTLVFCDQEGADNWRLAMRANNLPPLRHGLWIKPDAMPQLTGDRPANGAEAIVIAHPLGKKRWNGGGRPAIWIHCIERADRCHTTQKPIDLMLSLVSDFTDPGELVLDAFAGSGTTGVACLRLGRRFIGIEKSEVYAAVARERLRAEAQGLTLRDARAGQLPMFGESP